MLFTILHWNGLSLLSWLMTSTEAYHHLILRAWYVFLSLNVVDKIRKCRGFLFLLAEQNVLYFVRVFWSHNWTLLHWQNTSSLMMQWLMHGSADSAVCLTHTKFHCEEKREGRVGRSRKFEGRGHLETARVHQAPGQNLFRLGHVCCWVIYVFGDVMLRTGSKWQLPFSSRQM